MLVCRGGGLNKYQTAAADALQRSLRSRFRARLNREKIGEKRRPITIGEIDGVTKERTRAVKSLFETSGVPVDLAGDIDGWLKYHFALVSPLANALYKHDCDNYALAKDKETMRAMVRAAKEGGRVLKALGYTKRYPFKFNLFYWLPEMLNVKAVQGLLESKFAEVAFALHARAAWEEFFRLGDALAASDTPATETLTAAVLAMRLRSRFQARLTPSVRLQKIS